MRISRIAGIAALLLLAACASGPERTERPASAPTGTPETTEVAAAKAEPPPAVAPETSRPVVAESVAPMPSPAPDAATQKAETATPAESDGAPVVAPRAPTVVASPVRSAAVSKPASPAAAKPAAPVLAATPAVAADAPSSVRGTLQLLAGQGQSVAAEDLRQAVIYYQAESGGTVAKPGQYRIYTHNKQFEPASLVVPLGSTISFPNQDEILHNVFSVTPKSSFDLGIYGEGKSAEYTFKQTGLVLINCNVHHAMQASVLVVDTAYFTSPDKNGGFELAGLPAGRGKLMVWHPRASILSRDLRVPADSELSLRLTLTKPQVVEHLNKERKAY